MGWFNFQPSLLVYKQMKNLFGSGTGVFWGGPSKVTVSASASKTDYRHEACQSLRKTRNLRSFPIKSI